MVAPGSDAVVLDVRDLRTHFEYDDRTVRAVDGVSFVLHRDETLGIVGESGCGKSMTAASILRLLPSAAAHIVGGQVLFGQTDLLQLSEEEIRHVRGKRIALMAQDPMSALNPALQVGDQLTEALTVHDRSSKTIAHERAMELLSRTHIPEPRRVFGSYPHELSGGMRQRVILAMALMCQPEVLIADEPTTALDVTTQEQIIDLIQELQRELGLAVILISHNLGVVARTADQVMVMYAGKPMEYAETMQIFAHPSHPYTRGLLDTADLRQYRPREKLTSIPGFPPPLDDLPAGCVFHPRCSYAVDICRLETPRLENIHNQDLRVACHLAQSGTLEPWQRRIQVDPL